MVQMPSTQEKDKRDEGMNTELALDCLRAAIRNQHAILLTSGPGCGKTDLATLAAQLEDNDLLVTHPVVEDPTDKKGMPWVIGGQNDMGAMMRALGRLLVDMRKGEKSDDEMLRAIDESLGNYQPKATFLPFDEMDILVNAKKPTVCLLDDLGQAAPANQASNMHLLLARRIGKEKISDYVTFFACTNRRKDMAGVSGILEPVKSRFITIIQIMPNSETWGRWAMAQQWIPSELIAFLRWKPALLFDFQPTKDMSNSPCPRTWVAVAKIMTGGYPEKAHRELFTGAVGEGAALELLSFLKMYKDLESPDMVLMDPDKAKIPKEPSALYAMCGALAARASDQTFGQIAKYANRLSSEFSVLLIKDCTTRNRDLIRTKTYIEWSLKHSSVLS
jgi:hypothetical protein